MITTSLIISTYNWPKALELTLLSILKQDIQPKEIIIADDGSTIETKEIIDEYRKKSKVPILHVWHPDTGFRLAEIRNKALSIATGDYIIQIDGDVILHRKFISDHSDFALKNCFVKGRRAMLNSKISSILVSQKETKITLFMKGIKRREHGFRIPFYNRFFKPKQESSADGVMGSNMAFWRKDFIAVNGYNNELTGWGAEDKELAQRFVNNGLNKIKIKFSGIQYHIHHKESDKKNHDEQVLMIKNLQENKTIRCKNGLVEIKNDFIVYE